MTARSAAASVDTVPTTSSSPEEKIKWGELSYSQQYDLLFSKPLVTNKPIPKPSKEALEKDPEAKNIIFSKVKHVQKRALWNRKWSATDLSYAAFIGGMHLLCLLAPMTFSWPMVQLFFASYFVSGCLGITLSYHRMLSHKSFTCPKWLEYTLAYCGVLAAQGDPIEWVSGHRYHHLHTDTPLDPHSTHEGFWWSHAGWLLDNDVTLQRVGNRSNASEMEAQWFYRWLQKTWVWHVVAQFAVLFACGGVPACIWGGALRMVWVYHVTWFVNSATHTWGDQPYNAGDQSRNNWWVGILAFGEGWHNNHHAFEYSARHGFEWWQLDVTWMVVQLLQALGLATNVKLPTEAQKARLAYKQ